MHFLSFRNQTLHKDAETNNKMLQIHVAQGINVCISEI